MARHDLYRLLAALKRQGFASHSDLDDLLEDVHTQYVHVSTKRTITAQHDFAPDSAQAPFTIGTNADGQLVTGLNADQLDGSHATDFAAVSHTHTKVQITDLEPISATPAADTIPLANGSGDIADGWLSSNVPLLNAANTFTRGQYIDCGSDEVALKIDAYTGTPGANTLEIYNNDGILMSYFSATDGAGSEDWAYFQGEQRFRYYVRTYSSTATQAPQFWLAHEGGTIASPAVTPADARLGIIVASGREAAGDAAGAYIDFRNEDTGSAWAASTRPTCIDFHTAETTAPVRRVRLDRYGNIILGGTAIGASSKGNLHIINGTAPTGSVTNGIILYAEDVSASSELKVRDEGGTITTLSPHNFSLFPKPYDMAWSFYSRRGNKEINVDMYSAIRALEQLTGEQFIYERADHFGPEANSGRPTTTHLPPVTTGV